MSLPTLSSVHVNSALTNVAIGWKNPALVSDLVSPIVTVAKESDYYHIWTQADIFRNEATKVRPGAKAPRGGFSLSSTTYTAEEWGFAWPIPDRVRNNMDVAVNAEINATNRVMGKIGLAREIETMSVLTGSVWTGAAPQAAGDNWDTGGGDPLSNFETSIKGIQNKTGLSPNVCVMSWNTKRALRRHPDILAYLGIKLPGTGTPRPTAGIGPAIITDDVLAAVLDIPTVLTVGAIYNTAKEGQTASYSAILTDTVWIGYVAQAPAIDEPSALYTFRVGGPRVRTYREEAEEQDVVEARELYVTKATSLICGALITGTLA